VHAEPCDNSIWINPLHCQNCFNHVALGLNPLFETTLKGTSGFAMGCWCGGAVVD